MNAIERKGGGSAIPLQPIKEYDLDNDGKIHVSEFIEALRNDTEIPKHILQQIQEGLQQEHNAFITFRELISLVSQRRPKNSFQWALLRYIKYTIPPRRKKDEIDGEYEDEYTCNPPAICMLLISVLEISVFMYDSLSNGYASVNGPAGSLLIYNPYKRMEIWRYASYMFIHVGAFHLIVNIVVQILLGVPLEMVHGWWRILIVYISGVLGGSLGTSISDPTVFLAGASGGVYAIIAAHVATIIMNWSEMKFALLQLSVFLILTITDIGTAVYNRYINASDNKVGYVAHLTGALSGLLVGLYILRNLQVHSWEKKISWFAFVVYFVFIIALIVTNVAFPSYFPNQER